MMMLKKGQEYQEEPQSLIVDMMEKKDRNGKQGANDDVPCNVARICSGNFHHDTSWISLEEEEKRSMYGSIANSDFCLQSQKDTEGTTSLRRVVSLATEEEESEGELVVSDNFSSSHPPVNVTKTSLKSHPDAPRQPPTKLGMTVLAAEANRLLSVTPSRPGESPLLLPCTKTDIKLYSEPKKKINKTLADEDSSSSSSGLSPVGPSRFEQSPLLLPCTKTDVKLYSEPRKKNNKTLVDEDSSSVLLQVGTSHFQQSPLLLPCTKTDVKLYSEPKKNNNNKTLADDDDDSTTSVLLPVGPSRFEQSPLLLPYTKTDIKLYSEPKKKKNCSTEEDSSSSVLPVAPSRFEELPLSIPCMKTHIKLYSEPKTKEKLNMKATISDSNFASAISNREEQHYRSGDDTLVPTDLDFSLLTAESALKILLGDSNTKVGGTDGQENICPSSHNRIMSPLHKCRLSSSSPLSLNHRHGRPYDSSVFGNIGEKVAIPQKSMGRDIMDNVVRHLLERNQKLCFVVEDLKAQLDLQQQQGKENENEVDRVMMASSSSPEVVRSPGKEDAISVVLGDDVSWYYCEERGHFITRPSSRATVSSSRSAATTSTKTPLKLLVQTNSDCANSGTTTRRKDDDTLFCKEDSTIVVVTPSQRHTPQKQQQQQRHDRSKTSSTAVWVSPCSRKQPPPYSTTSSSVYHVHSTNTTSSRVPGLPRSASAITSNTGTLGTTIVPITPPKKGKEAVGTTASRDGISRSITCGQSVVVVSPSNNNDAALRIQISSLKRNLVRMKARNKQQAELIESLMRKVPPEDLSMSIVSALNNDDEDSEVVSRSVMTAAPSSPKKEVALVDDDLLGVIGYDYTLAMTEASAVHNLEEEGVLVQEDVSMLSVYNAFLDDDGDDCVMVTSTMPADRNSSSSFDEQWKGYNDKDNEIINNNRFQQYVSNLQKRVVWQQGGWAGVAALDDGHDGLMKANSDDFEVDNLLDAPLDYDNLEDIFDWASDLYFEHCWCQPEKEKAPDHGPLIMKWEAPPPTHSY